MRLTIPSEFHEQGRLTAGGRVAVLVAAVAATVRLGVLFFAGAISDDALITMRVARNLANGDGLVYNAGERVLAVSSPLYALFAGSLWWVLGDGALMVLRVLGGLADSVTAGCVALLAGGFAARSAGRRYEISAAMLGGSFYAAMSTTALIATLGLETGFYTLAIAGTFVALVADRTALAAGLAGLAAVLRPEGILVAGIVWVVAGWRSRWVPWRESLATGMSVVPYVLFALAYYGSVVPQSVVAKTLLLRSPSTQWSFFLNKFFLGRPAVWLLGIAVLLGIVKVASSRRDLVPLVAWGLLFVAGFSTLGMWWPWYLPPAMIAYTVLVGLGLGTLVEVVGDRVDRRVSRVALRRVAVVGVLVPLLLQTASYATRQRDAMRLYRPQRLRIARALNELTPHDATVMLEPLGMIGYWSSRRFYDYPGLASPQVTDALQELQRRVPGKPMDPRIMAHVLERVSPDYLVLREDEYAADQSAGILAPYEVVRTFPVADQHTERFPDFQTMYLLRRESHAGS